MQGQKHIGLLVVLMAMIFCSIYFLIIKEDGILDVLGVIFVVICAYAIYRLRMIYMEVNSQPQSNAKEI